MEDPRVEKAVQRIERALARIAAVAEQPLPGTPESDSALAQAHKELQSKVKAELGRLDKVIGALDQ